MHAFLLISQNSNIKSQIEELSKKLHTKIMEFPLAKIEDVRSLNNLLRLSFSEPTLIVCQNIEGATEEALNAFLKNLEEPQPNIYFALTSSSVRKVLPTIVSRCQIIKSTNKQISKLANEEDVKEFLDMTASQRLALFDKMKERDKAIEFIESLIFFLHDPPVGEAGKRDLKNMELLIKTRTCLKANGTVNLHLTNLVTQYA
jgi:DNA polymerase III delta prime subunit